MSATELIEVEKSIMDICMLLHTEIRSMATNTHNEDSDDSLMNSQEVFELDSFEALNHITESVKDLLGFKRTLNLMSEYKDDDITNQYQVALQKLEGEVRNHIKIEHQLRLYIEHTQQTLDESEKNLIDTERQFQDKIFGYEREKADLEHQLQSKAEEFKRLNEGEISSRNNHSESKTFSKDLSSLKLTADKDSLRIIELDRRSEKLEKEWAELKAAFFRKEKELLQLRRESAEIKSLMQSKYYVSDPSLPTSEFYRKKYEEKYIRVLDIERKIKCMQLTVPKKSTSLSNIKSSSHRSLSQLLASARSQRTLDVSVRDTSTTLSSNRSRTGVEKSKIPAKTGGRSTGKGLVRNPSSKLLRTSRK